MKHFSHPHSLKLSESTNKEEENDEEILCSGCELKVSSPDAYICTKRKCDFVLHKSCFELPTKTGHKSHPKHTLHLLSEPPRFSLYYDCNACDDLINGFSYNCDECESFRLHVKCASLPEYVACKAHSHALEMRYYTPEAGRYSCIVSCDVCDGSMREGYWSYFCKECDFGTHLDCAFSAQAVSEKDEEEENEESEEEWEVENENEDGDEEGERDEEDEYEVEVENDDEDEENENEEEDEDEEENENEDEEEGEEDEYEGRVENDDGDEEEDENEDEEEVEENENDDEENEDDGLSERRKLQMANLKAMDQMAISNFQLQMAEMNARFIRRM